MSDAMPPNAATARAAPAPSLRGALIALWPLLAGVGLLMLGNGLQASLLGLRAGTEGFGPTVTGWVMAAFFAGFLLGATWAPKAIVRVGHLRVFAALAAFASAAVLLHDLAPDPLAWAALRLISGLCFAGIFVVAESWLNERADNRNRGAVLAAYMVVSFSGMAGGQALLGLGDPEGAELFILVSVLISIAVAPALLSAAPAPAPAQPQTVPLRRLYAASPLGVVAVLAAGIVNGAVFGMGAVFAQASGYSVQETALFMVSIVLGAAVLQGPIGRLSDLFDRRKVILAISIGGAGLAALSIGAVQTPSSAAYALAFLYGGLALSLHSLALAYSNDYLEPSELVGASAGLVLVLGVGSVVGPILIGVALSVAGPHAFFGVLAALHGALIAFTLYRMAQRAAPDMADQGPFVAMASSPSAVSVVAAEALHAEELQSESGASRVAQYPEEGESEPVDAAASPPSPELR